MDRGSEAEVQTGADGGCRDFGPSRHDDGVRVKTQGAHLVGETQGLRQVTNKWGQFRERPQTASPLQASLSHELVQCSADGNEAAAVLGGQRPLRRKPLARRPLAGVEPSPKIEVNLVMERDRTWLE
jgi:hypothetical protein